MTMCAFNNRFQSYWNVKRTKRAWIGNRVWNRVHRHTSINSDFWHLVSYFISSFSTTSTRNFRSLFRQARALSFLSTDSNLLGAEHHTSSIESISAEVVPVHLNRRPHWRVMSMAFLSCSNRMHRAKITFRTFLPREFSLVIANWIGARCDTPINWDVVVHATNAMNNNNEC